MRAGSEIGETISTAKNSTCMVLVSLLPSILVHQTFYVKSVSTLQIPGLHLGGRG